MRLNKFMAMSGVDSRRKCDEIIASGRVRINARVVKKLGTQVNINRDIVTVDNKPIRIKGNFVYLMLNKPLGTVTTLRDPQHRRTVMDCLPRLNQRVFPVGRLDYNTSGLLLFTNDGDTAQKLIHPSFEIDKKYLVTITGTLSEKEIDILSNGVDIGGFVTSPASITLKNTAHGQSTYEIIIHEGKNRQIRRMFERINMPVVALKRVVFGKLVLGDLQVGHTRELTKEEIKYITSL